MEIINIIYACNAINWFTSVLLNAKARIENTTVRIMSTFVLRK